jgi:hypothetical protein
LRRGKRSENHQRGKLEWHLGPRGRRAASLRSNGAI